MPSFYKGNIPIIDDDSATTDIAFPKDAKFGLVPRDFATSPKTMFSAMPSEIKTIPRSEWDARYDEQEEQQSSLEHIYLNGGQPAFVNLDQNGHGDCWLFSTAHATMLQRLRSNQPLVRLNPHAGAIILNKLSGGWCGLSAKLAREIGQAEEGNGPGQWPGHSRDRRHDTPALREAMAAHKISEAFVDLTIDVYDQNLTEDQLATCLFNNQPGPVDFNHWGHSVCAVRWVRIESGDFGLLILNSWLEWGRFGLGVLRGSKRRPDSALSILVSVAA